MAQAGRGISVTNGTGGKGVTVMTNQSSMESRAVLIKNTDATVTLQLLGQNDDGTPQTYGQGYDWGPGAELGFDLAPGEAIVAAAAPATTVLVNYYWVRSVDVGG